jgi:hypothetical protein
LSGHLALDVHEDQAARETDGNHHQFGPEGPLQLTSSNLFGCPKKPTVLKSPSVQFKLIQGVHRYISKNALFEVTI